MADLAVGFSRQLYGLSMHSERAQHRMFEQWHPLGVVGVITAFNFPNAVWAWNAMVAAVCGDACIWKPSLITPLTAIATSEICWKVLREQEVWKPAGIDPADIFPLIIGTDAEVGETMIADRRLPLISATGSCRMGRRVGEVVAKRLGRCLLELGGNNAIIVMDDADMELVARAVLFGSVGTAGQRCTTTRRLLVHEKVVDALCERTKNLRVGDALAKETEIGPVVDAGQLKQDMDYIDIGQQEGAKLRVGGQRVNRETEGYYLQPALFTEVSPAMRIAREEIFGPVAAVIRVKNYEEALAVANDTEFGLSAGIVTTSLKYATHFKRNAEAGMVMVNVPTAGVDFHVPFGGRKGSSYGPKEQGKYAAEFFTQVKTAYTAAG
jgi:aldehyde dehydrogenase (NAD+)